LPVSAPSDYSTHDSSDSAVYDMLDFSRMEEALSRLGEEQPDQLIISDELEPILRLASEEFITAPPDAAILVRILFLIEKTLPGKVGANFAQLFPRYLDYRITEERYLEQQAAAEIPQQDANAGMAQFQRLKQIRAETLGETLATQLFRGQHLLTEYMLQRRIISESTALDDADKQVRIDQLQAEFSAQMKELQNIDEASEQRQ